MRSLAPVVRLRMGGLLCVLLLIVVSTLAWNESKVAWRPCGAEYDLKSHRGPLLLSNKLATSPCGVLVADPILGCAEVPGEVCDQQGDARELNIVDHLLMLQTLGDPRSPQPLLLQSTVQPALDFVQASAHANNWARFSVVLFGRGGDSGESDLHVVKFQPLTHSLQHTLQSLEQFIVGQSNNSALTPVSGLVRRGDDLVRALAKVLRIKHFSLPFALPNADAELTFYNESKFAVLQTESGRPVASSISYYKHILLAALPMNETRKEQVRGVLEDGVLEDVRTRQRREKKLNRKRKRNKAIVDQVLQAASAHRKLSVSILLDRRDVAAVTLLGTPSTPNSAPLAAYSDCSHFNRADAVAALVLAERKAADAQRSLSKTRGLQLRFLTESSSLAKPSDSPLSHRSMQLLFYESTATRSFTPPETGNLWPSALLRQECMASLAHAQPFDNRRPTLVALPSFAPPASMVYLPQAPTEQDASVENTAALFAVEKVEMVTWRNDSKLYQRLVEDRKPVLIKGSPVERWSLLQMPLSELANHLSSVDTASIKLANFSIGSTSLFWDADWKQPLTELLIGSETETLTGKRHPPGEEEVSSKSKQIKEITPYQVWSVSTASLGDKLQQQEESNADCDRGAQCTQSEESFDGALYVEFDDDADQGVENNGDKVLMQSDMAYGFSSLPKSLLETMQETETLFLSEEDTLQGQQFVWLSSPGVVLQTHFDQDHNMFAQIRGRKRFILFSPAQHEKLHLYPRTHPLWHKSQLHCLHLMNLTQSPSTQETKNDSATFFKSVYPNFHDVKILIVDVEPGDVLYIPPYWFHCVHSLTASASISTWSRVKDLYPAMDWIYAHDHKIDLVTPGRSRLYALRLYIDMCVEVIYGSSSSSAVIAHLLRSRYPSILRKSMFVPSKSQSDSAKLCGSSIPTARHVFGDTNFDVQLVTGRWRTVERAAGGEVRDILFLDWIEELVASVVGVKSSLDFFIECFQGQGYEITDVDLLTDEALWEAQGAQTGQFDTY